MRNHFSESDLREILGADLQESDIIDTRIKEAYIMIRNSEKTAEKGIKKELEGKREKRTGKHTKAWKRIAVGFGSVAAVLALAVSFCVMDPVMAKEVPLLGGLFAKVADIFSFGALPEEGVTELYTAAGEEFLESGEQKEREEQKALYQKTDNGITVTLTEEYASNQAVYIGICVENEQAFPEMAKTADGSQYLYLKTRENYSFRDKEGVCGARNVEGKWEDAHTFIGIMRIDYSEIDKDESKYLEAFREAEEKGEELWLTDENYFDYIEQYEIPETFTMALEITDIIGDLADPVKPEGMKSGEEQAQMTEEEWQAYMKTLPAEWYQFPNEYENWSRKGSWKFDLTIAQKDGKARVISVHETNADGVGLESLEVSSVEMTLHVIEPAGVMTFAVALDADGNKIENGGTNADELAIEGHDISKVYVYVCDYEEYMDELKGYGGSGGQNGRRFQEVLEERALFKTVVSTEN